MDHETTDRVILFADLGGSTRLYEELGDEEARRRTGACMDLMIACVDKYAGRVVKTIGDEVMATFESADAATSTGTAILNELATSGLDLGAHVGIHAGAVIHEDGDVFGDTVNVAARMVGLAKTGEILGTRALVDRLSPPLAAVARRMAELPIRGKTEELEVFALSNVGAEGTSIGMAIPVVPAGAHSLVLRHAGREYHVDETHPALTFGRSEENELMLSTPWASRRHARIKLRHGKFVLMDESSNGTLVRREGTPVLHVHREDFTLQGRGTVAAGGAPAGEAPEEINYEVG
jgi:adenylate cyclase